MEEKREKKEKINVFFLSTRSVLLSLCIRAHSLGIQFNNTIINSEGSERSEKGKDLQFQKKSCDKNCKKAFSGNLSFRPVLLVLHLAWNAIFQQGREGWINERLCHFDWWVWGNRQGESNWEFLYEMMQTVSTGQKLTTWRIITRWWIEDDFTMVQWYTVQWFTTVKFPCFCLKTLTSFRRIPCGLTEKSWLLPISWPKSLPRSSHHQPTQPHPSWQWIWEGQSGCI